MLIRHTTINLEHSLRHPVDNGKYYLFGAYSSPTPDFVFLSIFVFVFDWSEGPTCNWG